MEALGITGPPRWAKAPVIVAPQGETALVANDGAPIPPERVLGRVIEG